MKATDSDLIARAVALGEHGRRSASPNPWVGSVIVDEQGAIAGEGWHRSPGTPHAEVHALEAAGERARNGTAYVTLEPCALPWAHAPVRGRADRSRCPARRGGARGSGCEGRGARVRPAPRGRARSRGRAGRHERAAVAGAVPAPPSYQPGVVPGQDGDEPRRQDGGGRRLVALDHRRRRTRRRPSPPRRVASGRDRRGHGTRRSPVAHRSRRRPSRRSSAATRAPRRPRPRPCRRAALRRRARAHAGRHHRSCSVRGSGRVAGVRREGRDRRRPLREASTWLRRSSCSGGTAS